ncbi:MAG: L,D-transpeptidase family protein [Selenomonadaceae bacterium]|nr:L,D-transpeptidase family protein [Selenomonadaceae bacterium]MBQ7493971.1 L,D-transpeptidase family protein [Selenomonadaceae bacterium]
MSALKFFTAIIFILCLVAAPAQAQKKILINSASRLMLFYDGDTKLAVYHLGLGKVSTPTPTGYYKIKSKEINPPWIDPSDPEFEVPSGPDNPLGYRWMEISGNYGIHGTNRPESIGGYVSNGCIRMNERDVEELFDAVEVGTPVEITYNRVVVEKSPDGDVVYYIYPDGYGIQDITVADVTKWLEPFGVLAFESEYNISQKIEAADGEPTFLGKPYNVEINGQLTQPTDANNTRFFAKAVLRDGISYMPVVPIAKILRLKLEWNKTESTLKSRYGKVVCYERKGQLYCNADDAPILFNMEGGLQTNADGSKIFRFKSLPVVEKPPVAPITPEVKAPFEDKKDLPKPEEKIAEPKPEEKISEPKPEEKISEPKPEEKIAEPTPEEKLPPADASRFEEAHA